MMPLPELLAVLMVLAVCALLFAGYPVALTLGGVSFAIAALAHLAGAMDIGLLYALPQRIFGVMTNTVLLAIPLFIFMGVMLERSRIAEDLLETMGRLFGSLPGGLGISVVLVGVLLAAAKGVVWATLVHLAAIKLPTLLGAAVLQQLGGALLAPVLLIVVVLGSILIGLATPTEAAAVGAVGAILLAALRIDGAGRRPARLFLARLPPP